MEILYAATFLFFKQFDRYNHDLNVYGKTQSQKIPNPVVTERDECRGRKEIPGHLIPGGSGWIRPFSASDYLERLAFILRVTSFLFIFFYPGSFVASKQTPIKHRI